METVLQLVNRLLTRGKYIWMPDAFERAKANLAQQHEQVVCSVEGGATDMLMKVATNHDKRFNILEREDLAQVTLDEVRETTMLQLNPSELDVAIVGDIDQQETERLILQYLGTVPKTNEEQAAAGRALYMNDARAPAPAPAPPMPCPDRQLRVNIEDSIARSAGYMSGPAPNRWGVLPDGRHIRDVVAALAPNGTYSNISEKAAAAAYEMEVEQKRARWPDPNTPIELASSALKEYKDRWAHPLYAPVVLAVLQELISSRLYQTVRDRKQLTYDTTFQFNGYERMDGAYWMTYVTASPEKIDLAIKASQLALRDLSPEKEGVSKLDIAPSRRTLVKQHETEIRSNAYWASLLAGTQSDAWPHKRLVDLKDFYQLVDAVTVGDMLALIKIIGIADEDQRYTCIGVSGGAAPAIEEDTGHSFPGMGHSRAQISYLSAELGGDNVEHIMSGLSILALFVLSFLGSRRFRRLRWRKLQTPLIHK